MNKNKRDFKLTPVSSIPIKVQKQKEIKIDVQEREYLKHMGRKHKQPKQIKMTANYIQEIYNRERKEKQIDE